MRAVDRFLRDERGATAVEYALICAGIGAAMMFALNPLGTQLKTTFNAAKDGLDNASK